jgi:hypothetical protein
MGIKNNESVIKVKLIETKIKPRVLPILIIILIVVDSTKVFWRF